MAPEPSEMDIIATAPQGDRERPWEGEFRFTPFRVGDAGRAATVPSYPDSTDWDRRDTVLDGVVLRGADGASDLHLRAASTRGRAHRFHGRVRQDAYGYRCDGRFAVAAVADGVSAGALSHLAADTVTRDGCHLVAKRLATVAPTDLDWGEILHILATKVIKRGQERLPGGDQLTPQEIAASMATTVLFAVVRMHPVHGGFDVWTFAHGDTSAWILRGGQRWQPQRPVKNQDVMIAESTTPALPYLPRPTPPAVHAQLAPADTLVLITDGIGDPLGDGSGTVGAFLAQQWHRPPEPLAFAAHVDFARRSHDDDRTAVAIWPDPAAAS